MSQNGEALTILEIGRPKDIDSSFMKSILKKCALLMLCLYLTSCVVNDSLWIHNPDQPFYSSTQWQEFMEIIDHPDTLYAILSPIYGGDETSPPSIVVIGYCHNSQWYGVSLREFEGRVETGPIRKLSYSDAIYIHHHLDDYVRAISRTDREQSSGRYLELYVRLANLEVKIPQLSAPGIGDVNAFIAHRDSIIFDFYSLISNK